MDKKISAVINTLNEEKNIERVIKTVEWANEVVIVDDGSTDRTLRILSELKTDGKLKVFKHKSAGFVEPARNFAISKATGDWILVLDADEEIPETLSKRLQELVRKGVSSDFVEIPRKNIIFGKWMRYSGWWPDYQIRFFKKGTVSWRDQIHSKPDTKGVGLSLESEEKWAIIHYNYQIIGQFIDRMNRYSQVQVKELTKSGYKFKWQDLFEKPLSEFLSRFFAKEGYKDGLHGLALSLLQAFSFLVVILKVWEREKFKQQDFKLAEFEDETKVIARDVNYWINQSKEGTLKRFIKVFKK